MPVLLGHAHVHLLAHCSWYSSWFIDLLRVLKMIKRHLDCCKKTRDVSDQAGAGAAIQIWLMMLRTLKCWCLSVIIMFAKSHPAAMLKITWTSWVRGAWRFIFWVVQRNFLFIWQIKSPGSIPSWRSFGDALGVDILVIWEQSDPVGSKEVGWVLGTVNATTCELDSCPSWPVKSA